MKTHLKHFRHSKLVVALFAAFTLISCSDDDSENSTSPAQTSNQTSISWIAVSNPDFAILSTALTRVNLMTTLAEKGSYTVFAPTNEAFETFLSDNGFSSLDEVPNDVLKEIVLNHVIVGENFSTDLATGYVKTLAKGSASSSNALSMYIDVSNGGVKINGISNVTTADIDANNGVIHVVDAVIGLPTIVTHATANSNFSTLVAALTRSDQPNFVEILNGTGSSPFTVFAPTNEAFSNLLTEFGWANLAAVPQSVLENTLKYHVVAGANVLSTSLTNNMSVSTFQGQTFTVGLTNGATITDQNNRVSSIIATDVQCSNGVIHVLNKVIVPSL